MKKPKFSLNYKDDALLELVKATDKKTLAIWAKNCVERILPLYEEEFPHDDRPRKALNALQNWIDTGVFKMAVIRKAALDSHAAAREVGEDNPARSVARAAGQAVATAHAAMHSLAAANYVLQAIYRASIANDMDTARASHATNINKVANTDNINDEAANADAAVKRERKWQYHHLLELRQSLS